MLRTSDSLSSEDLPGDLSVDKDTSMPNDDYLDEDVAGNKIIANELNEPNDTSSKVIHHYEGSDSGLDIATTINLRIQCALSNNSGDYASSARGKDIEAHINDNVSCGSSMISCTSDLGGEQKCINSIGQNLNYECNSENGSESSSVATGCMGRKALNIKKKNGAHGNASVKSLWKTEAFTPPTAGSFGRTKSRVSNTRNIKNENDSLQICEHVRTREKAEKPLSNASSKATTPPIRSTSVRRTPKPESLPCALSSNANMQRVTNRTPSTTRARTPGTPSDDGRWPSIGSRVAAVGIGPKRGSSVAPDLGSLKLRGQVMSFDSKCLFSLGNLANTLPRRRKQKSVEDLRGHTSRSSSTSRDNGMVSSISVTSRKNMASFYLTPSKSYSTQNKTSNRKITSKTKIYHEMGIQTVLTVQDLQNAFSGKSCSCVQIDLPELAEKQTQSDIRDLEMKRLREEVQQLRKFQKELGTKLEEKKKKVMSMEQQIFKEREEKLSVQKELNHNTERVIEMLELTPHLQSNDGQCDSLMMLESQIQMSGHELVEKQQEIGRLRKLCRSLQTEMERVLNSHECLRQEKISMEREAVELQDFLQYEKTAMCDALSESELEYQNCKKMLSGKEEEVKVLRDECRHLVRLNEQRRQENKLMQSKYALLESKTKESKCQQITAASGASVALSGLYTRLESLVEQLIASYNISEQDLEGFAYHNEAYPNSGISCNVTPEYDNNIDDGRTEQANGSLSPQRNQSFIAAVISAIRNATAPSGKKLRSFSEKLTENPNADESDSTEMLDSETEPCLMMDNVLEDVTVPDSHSHNMVSSTGIAISQIELPPGLVNAGDDSLHNLSQAITNRQEAELQITSTALNAVFGKNSDHTLGEEPSFHETVAEMSSIMDFCTTQTLVDQVVDVDNLITKLLKALRLIQMDNDICIQQLIVDKNKLQQNKEDLLEKLKGLQNVNIKLQDELMDATQELMLKATDLTTSKADIQRHRNEIDRLNEDICQLSTLCSQNHSQCSSGEQVVTTENILRLLRTWNDSGFFAEAGVKSFLTSLCDEKVQQYDETLTFQANISNILNERYIQEMRLQYSAVENALKNLHELNKSVQDNPSLLQLQHQLEKMNVKSHESFLFYSSLLRLPTSSSQDHINANNTPTQLEKKRKNYDSQK